MEKRVIRTLVWDIDDVLNDLTRMWFEKEWHPGHPGCRLRYEDLSVNPPHELLGVSKAEYLLSLDRFRLSPAAAGMRPDATLMKWFEDNGSLYRHVALTARPRKTAGAGAQWLLEHFGKWFQVFCFVPSGREGETSCQADRNKSDFLAWLGKADYFIDDNAANHMSAESLGIKSFLVARPWNSGGLTLPEILGVIAGESGARA